MSGKLQILRFYIVRSVDDEPRHVEQEGDQQNCVGSSEKSERRCNDFACNEGRTVARAQKAVDGPRLSACLGYDPSGEDRGDAGRGAKDAKAMKEF